MENVKGAQKWVGQARWHYGSYYLWGDVPALMPIARNGAGRKAPDSSFGEGRTGWFGKEGGTGVKNNGDGTWFGVSHGKEYPDQPGNLVNGIKQGGNWWHDPNSFTRRFSSRSAARKHASAMIAKIPYVSGGRHRSSVR